jgi:hypothetical protein
MEFYTHLSISEFDGNNEAHHLSISEFDGNNESQRVRWHITPPALTSPSGYLPLKNLLSLFDYDYLLNSTGVSGS